jgi:hypothetical protein
MTNEDERADHVAARLVEGGTRVWSRHELRTPEEANWDVHTSVYAVWGTLGEFSRYRMLRPVPPKVAVTTKASSASRTAMASKMLASGRQAAKGAVMAARVSSTRAYATAVSDTKKSPSPVDAFATGSNAYYTSEMYRLWKQVSLPPRVPLPLGSLRNTGPA